ncbi:MAG: hypothetical protein HYR66_02980, partial [Sphingobacteriales bacterium]|nr:hypothetical protein [Sphingobacteriales bacterium]
SGGNVSITGGSAVNFGAGFITASNGNAYSGNVSVSVHYLNPTDQAFSTSAPGNLKSAGNTNQSGALQSFGVIAVEMNDASGNKLQLASGNTAAITIPISSALQNKAPSSIPLWYFDNTNGAWKREGTATKQGNNYVGTVKHFTFWNAGDLAGSVNLTATFIDSINRTPFANRKVTITRSDSTSKSDFTNSSGTISGLVPVNEVLKMQVLDTCGVIVYSKNIGPFGADTILPNINVTAGNCGDSTQYINLTLNGVNYSWYYASTSGSHGDTTTSIIGGRTDSLPYVQGVIWSANTSPGNYTFSLYTIINNTTSYNTYVQDNLNTEVTQYGGVGQYINGSASGWVKNFPVATTDSFPFSINYRVRRIK